MENLFDLTGKSVLVAGGSGLIGTAIVRVCQLLHAEVKNLDLKDGDLYIHSGNDLSIYYLEDNPNIPNVFINTTHPYPRERHLGIFISATEYFAYRMRGYNGSSIINIASIYGVVGSQPELYKDVEFDMPSIYAAAKGGIIAHSRDIATKYAKYGVRVNCVSPGGVYDENRHPPVFEKGYSERTPMGRMATPEDIAWPVAFLASDASKYITGQNIVVDGGWTAW